MNNFLWWIGWRPKPALGLALIFGIGLTILLVIQGIGFNSIFGLFLGIPFVVLWIWGTVYINGNYNEYLNKGLEIAKKGGSDKLSIDHNKNEVYVLYTSKGSAPLVKPAKYYTYNILYIKDKFLGIYEECGYNLVKRINYTSSKTRELYYKHINGVDYSHPFFKVKTSSGDTIKYQCASTNADSALSAVRKKLRVAQA